MRSPRQMTPFTRPWSPGRPSVTAILIALLVAIGSAQWLFIMLDGGETLKAGSMVNWLGLSAESVNEGRYWQFFSFMFLYLGPFPLYLAASLIGLYFVGREVEPIVGPHHFLGIFLAGNLFGGVAHWLASLQGLAPANMALVGISAGVVALLVAFATILPELDVSMRLFFLLPVQVRAKFIGLVAVLIAAALWATQTAMAICPEAMLGGALVGWLYVKRLGYGSPFAIQRFFCERRQRAARIARMPLEQFICEEIDPILDKIAREGMHSLTRSERRILESGREKIAARG